MGKNGSRLPYNADAERAVLGAFLLGSPASDHVLGSLTEDHFLVGQHRAILRRIRTMRRAGVPVDLITLLDALETHGELNTAGGPAYVASLIDGVHRQINVDFYAKIVVRDARLRQLAHLGEELKGKALAPRAEVADLEQYLVEATRKLSGTETIQTWEQIPTLDRLPDHKECWLIPGIVPEASVSLLAGTAGCGKTWLSMSVLKAVSTGGLFLGRQCVKRPVLYLDRENPLVVWRKRTRILKIEPNENSRIWGSWMDQPPPLIGDPILLRIADKMKPLIIFDSFIRFHEADENSAREMARVMGQLRELANAGATILTPHHRDKSESQNFRGSTDILAGVDLAFLLKQEKDGDLQLKCFKNRFDQEFSISLRPDFSEQGDFTAIDSPRQKDNDNLQQKLLKLIDEHPGQTQNWLVEETAKRSDFSKRQTIQALQRGNGKLWNTEQGPRNSILYHPRDADIEFEDS